MRVTHSMIYDRTLEGIRKNYEGMLEAQSRLASGRKVSRPSDDVVGVSRAMRYSEDIDAANQYLKNISDAFRKLAFAEGSMGAVGSALGRAHELALMASNGTLGADERASIASEVEGLREHLLGLANSRLDGKHIFSGYRTDTAAFDAAGAYQGDSGLSMAHAGDGLNVTVNVTGAEAFSHGGKSYFQTLDELSAALGADDINGVRAAMDELWQAHGHSVDVRAELGARMNVIEYHGDRHEDNKVIIRKYLSEVEDTDIVEAVSELSKAELALQALKDSASRIMSLPLMEFMG
jgi:flagellar hook-associated protein 3 FlgL